VREYREIHINRGRWCFPAAAVWATLLGGCLKYHSMPLDASSVGAALTPPSPASLHLRASEIHHPLLPPLDLQPDKGLTPDEAAVVAVLINPVLRAERDQHSAAQAAVLQAQLLPNPQLTSNYDFVTGGNTAGAVNAYGWGVSYDLRSLLAHNAGLRSAQRTEESVNLSVAWREWQTAEAAKLAAYDLLSLQAQLNVASEIDERLQENLRLLQHAVAEHFKTAIDLAAAEAAANDAHAVVLQARRDVEHQRIALDRALGVPESTDIKLRHGLALPSLFIVPSDKSLLGDLEHRRLDLIALQHGYQSQEETLRAAVINQFPKINLGFERSSDDTNVHLAGMAVTIDLPIFDRNQGVIAAEKATRQRLFDEYVSRVFEARNDIASALADLRAINGQIADAQAALPNLRQLVDVYRQAVDHGNADVLSYYVAWNSLAQKNLNVLKLQQQLADTKVALELASGRYFPEVSPSTGPSTQASPSASMAARSKTAGGFSQ
jgi:outer membrane protein TolC